MKRILCALLIVTLFGCKKENTSSENQKSTVRYEVSTSTIANFTVFFTDNWGDYDSEGVGYNTSWSFEDKYQKAFGPVRLSTTASVPITGRIIVDGVVRAETTSQTGHIDISYTLR